MVIKNLVIRADASTQIGTGHIMRCLALALAWQEKGGQAMFVLANKSPALEARLQLEGMKVVYLSVEAGSSEDAKQTADFVHQFAAQWLVVDGYHFGAEYQKAIKNFGVSLLFLDDYGHADHYYADLVLNQNISAHEDLYQRREVFTRLLLGTQYVLLRREFWQWRVWQREINPIARKLLVTLGGSDPDNVTLKVIHALPQVNVDDLEVIIVVGGSNPHYEVLQAEVAASKLSISLQQNVNNMPKLMAWADLAISAGGSTNWELAFMGLPSLLITVADNQKVIAQHLGGIGATTNLGWHEAINTEQIVETIVHLSQSYIIRTKMSEMGRQLVDGEGCKRVIAEIQRSTVKLRDMCESDRQILWEWANDIQVREVSFSSDPITWDDHVHWFSTKLIDPNSQLYIATDANDLSIGQVRFDMHNQEATISISIDRQFRHQGYGHKIIQLAVARICLDSGVKIVHAYIKLNNQSSVRAFEKAGFQHIRTVGIQGHQAIQLSLELGNTKRSGGTAKC